VTVGEKKNPLKYILGFTSSPHNNNILSQISIYKLLQIFIYKLLQCVSTYVDQHQVLYNLKNGSSILMQNVSFVAFWLLFGLVYFEITNF